MIQCASERGNILNNNIKNKILALTLAGIIPCTLTGCNLKKETPELLPSIKSRSESQVLNDFILKCDSINPQYNYEELYPKMEEVIKFSEKKMTEEQCHYKFDKNIDTVIENIMINTEEYVKGNKEYTSPFTNTYMDLDFYSILKKSIKKIIKSQNSDINEDIHKINDLKIVLSKNNDFFLATYENDMIKINIEDVYNMYRKEESISKYLEFIISHELNHSRQFNCSCKKENRGGLTFLNEEKSIPLEASAESELYNTNKFKFKDYNIYSYSKERTDESFLLLLGLSNSEDINTYYESVFDGDYEKFYDFCGIRTDEELHSLYKIMYAIDSKYQNTNLSNINKDKDLEIQIGDDYKIDIFKKTLKNLAISTEENDSLSLQDNLAIFTIIKNVITNSTFYSEEFKNNVLYLEEEYINFLSDYFSMTENDILYFEEDSQRFVKKLVKFINKKKTTNANEERAFLEKYPIAKAIIIPNINTITNSYDTFLNTFENKKVKVLK